MKTEKEILKAIKNHPDYFLTSIIKETDDNPENGFSKKEDCASHIEKEKTSWGSNLIGWIEEKNNRFYPCFNIYD